MLKLPLIVIWHVSNNDYRVIFQTVGATMDFFRPEGVKHLPMSADIIARSGTFSVFTTMQFNANGKP